MTMADFCLECLKEFEPNANINNVVFSNVDYFCEGCGEFKSVVIEYDAEYIERKARYIDINKVRIPKGFFNDLNVPKVYDWLDSQPIADVVEVVHGEWIYHETVASYDGTKSGYSCSECCSFVDEEIFDSDEFHKSFCGCCGAKMDGDKK